ncbi:hypothetical protein ANTRET_LOCUS8959 [Anthophora retusa]
MAELHFRCKPLTIVETNSRKSVFPFTWRDLLEIDALEKSVAIVKCGRNWGTGVLLAEENGTFVTCAHVVTTVVGKIRLSTVRYDRISISFPSLVCGGKLNL